MPLSTIGKSNTRIYNFYDNARINTKLKGLSPTQFRNKPLKEYTKPKYNFWIQYTIKYCWSAFNLYYFEFKYSETPSSIEYEGINPISFKGEISA